MNLNALFDVLLSPLGIFSLLVIVLVIRFTFKNDFNICVILAALALFASFIEFKDPFGRPTPALVFPLQQLRQYGRLITIGLLVLITSYWLKKQKDRHINPLLDVFSIKTALLMIQFLIFVKNLIYGSPLIAILTFTVFLLVYFMFHKGVAYWFTSEKVFKRSVFCFLFAVILFVLMALYQSVFDSQAMLLFNGRFIGMTGNPQHAAVLLTSGVPLFLACIIDTQKIWQKVLLVLGLLFSLYYLMITGSRTGLLMALIAILIFLIQYKAAGLKWGVFGVIVAFVLVGGLNYNPFTVEDEAVIGRLQSTENTREDVVEVQINQFTRSPIFGVKPRGDRLGFSENSYLAVAASLGIIGLIPLFFMIRGIAKMLFQLWKGARYSKNKHFYFLVVAGLVSLLAGAFVEAYLLGNITWPTILLLCYVHWGYYLLQKDAHLNIQT